MQMEQLQNGVGVAGAPAAAKSQRMRERGCHGSSIATKAAERAIQE
jgi:hypothetical protein